MALGGTGLVQQGWHAQPLPLGQPSGEVIDAFPEEANALRQAESFPPGSKPLSI